MVDKYNFRDYNTFVDNVNVYIWGDYMENMDEFYKELRQAVKEIEPYYDVDKIKPYSVYIWTKAKSDDYPFGDNIFDIMKDEIVFYDKNHVVPEEVMTIIRNIQSKLIRI